MTWLQSLSNEFGRLAQGNASSVHGTDTIKFIPPTAVPPGHPVTYASFVCDYRPLKEEKYRVRLVVCGDKLFYDDDADSPTATLLETKLLLNSVLSGAKHGAKFMTCDIKDFFLATLMQKAEYMKIPFQYFPEDIITRYSLRELLASDGYIYIKITKGMYELKQASVLAYNNLVKNLKDHGYAPIPHSVGLWRHNSRPLTFCLCVDDFGIKYENKADADHLLAAFRQFTPSPPIDLGNISAGSISIDTMMKVTSISLCQVILNKF